MKNNTSIIICSFNEEKTIADVVSSCCKYNAESEVIVVDDGSTDATESILVELQKSYIFTYEKLPQNKGKSWAMAHGVELSTNDVILFWDADLSNIRKEHFENLLRPIFNDTADMVLGQPSETLIDYRINPFKDLSGQRAMRKKDLIPIIDEIRHTRFGVETYINLYFRAQSKRIKYVLLEGLEHPTKYEKTTLVKATKEFIFEGKEIATTLIQNQDLIIKRVQNIVYTNKESINKNLIEVQKEINKEIKTLVDKVNPFV